MYCEKVSANPDNGLDKTHNLVFSQNGSLLVTISLIVLAGMTAYEFVNTARSSIKAVCGGKPPLGA